MAALHLFLVIFAKSIVGMQFKHPELLWALLLLLIPIFIHLFQLRRFKKTAFTNVKVLQKVISESRRSNTIKKWLLLITRLALLTVLIIAFAQPYFANKSALKQKEIVIYLDDSFSMQAKTEKGPLLENAIQGLVQSIPKNDRFTLFTNEKVFKNITIQDIQNDLLGLGYTKEQLGLDEISLKANTYFEPNLESEKNLILISDFQQRIASKKMDLPNSIRRHLVQLAPRELENISIDSVYLGKLGMENIEVTALISSTKAVENTPVSLYDGEKLIAKTSAAFDKNNEAEVHFTIPEGQSINGKIEISDVGLTYDNLMYFNIDKKDKIKVMVIGSANNDYLKRIYSADEFQFSTYVLADLNYSSIDFQNIIILNELESAPTPLSSSLRTFLENGGSLVVIPSNEIDLGSYNALLNEQHAVLFAEKVNSEKNITDITFSHPLYDNVFEKNVGNFQYPKVAQHYKVKSTIPKILSLQDGSPFLIGNEGLYVFTASIATGNSNFKSSPLIVPTFYNMGQNSLKLPQIYQIIGGSTKVDIPFQLSKDNILKLSNESTEFIPQQQSLANKVTLSFQDNNISDGTYKILDNGNLIKNISFNHSREESELLYLNIEQLNSSTRQRSVNKLFQNMQNDNTITELWKWFVILALLFIVMEVLIQKYFK